ncbi:DUF1501 domain-containing protein [Burkholderia cenocepacia]|uniref:DUF1501 domain-containing protein n=1 Tax=Burkholderia cenocepacia TaxID=95486 RepID=UPI00209CE79C|nr:DUF1501 domain-containing protein [Burkholderia cenocepacia]MCO8321280.1 DUF1501 domain-containing protein [Burkholderia cenocepacia]MCO8328460.1 DUF1501 domain-containing protein [Burkholderia cenocepacia]MCO8335747.1 DUF1501 domain-containing protein [Burkholderia cenocepacia]MCO8343135.1 DUF1501 domain-containing protein [Burkholderia cenocepacia]MCO8356417.1 DUF1501 domain-containing protein [Burkholderia cenocepacia]
MNRRDFLTLTGAAAAAGVSMWQAPAMAATVPQAGRKPAAGYANVLVLVELKGGNDGLNTVVPYADPLYYQFRRSIGIKRDQVLQLDAQTGLHPSLAPLMPLWRDGQVAVVQGVGYPQPNLSHFRSIEIWDTASRSDQYLHEGWLTRTFAQAPVPPGFAADGVVLGSAEMGPLSNGARAIALVNPAQFIRAARLAEPSSLREQNPALAHIIDVENDIVKAADRLRPRGGMREFRTAFPAGAFGTSVKTAMQVLAACEASGPGTQDGVAVLRLTLNGFDTHQNQPGQQAALLKQFAQGMSAMRAALIELGRWNETLVMTYAEFGRRVRENQSNGTDHGTAAPHFVMGGRVAGGLYGAPPALGRLDGNGNLPVAVDFRQLYATVLGPWWGLDATRVLQQRFDTLPLLKA